jgi:hypothetical protein
MLGYIITLEDARVARIGPETMKGKAETRRKRRYVEFILASKALEELPGMTNSYS